MAQLDGSIYFQGQGGLARGFEQGMSMVDMMQKSKLAQKAADREEGIDKAYAAGLVKGPDGATTYDGNKTMSALAGGGYGREAATFSKNLQSEKIAQQKAMREQISEQADFLGRAAHTLSQSKGHGYDQLLAEAQKAGFDVSSMPPVYGPDAQQRLDFFAGKALTAKEQMDKHFKGQELEIKNKEFGLKQQEVGLKRSELAQKKMGGATEGRKALDKDFAKDYNDWTSAGRATVDKNLAKLKEAKAALENDSTLTGSIRGLAPDWVRNNTNEKAIVTRDNVRGAAQSALKAALGSSFTEREGERIMNDAFNEKISTKANLDKLEKAIQEIETTKVNNDRKAAYFQQYGTLSGLENPPTTQQQVAQKPGAKAPVKVFKTTQIEWAD